MNLGRVFLVAGKRTPFGKFGGSLKKMTPVDLALLAAKPLVTGKEDQIDHVILGNVIPSSTDTLYGARHLALKLGLPMATPAYNINRLCGSGIQVILDGKKMIDSGEAQAVLVAGVENMSMAPHLTYGGRFGTKYGGLKSGDMLFDALTDQYIKTPMGVTAENLGEKYNISKEECDIFSQKSHEKVTMAYEKKWLSEELVTISDGRIHCEQDEHWRKEVSLEDMKKLKPSFKKDGVVTAGTASGIVDGACALLLASEEFCLKQGLEPLAEIVAGQVIGVDPSYMGIGPVNASLELIKKQKIEKEEIDLWEINEAFAAQTLACQRELNIPDEKLNIWGGAIALGHPLAASGSRISLTLARQLKTYKKKWGIASACIGGGQGISVLLKSL